MSKGSSDGYYAESPLISSVNGRLKIKIARNLIFSFLRDDKMNGNSEWTPVYATDPVASVKQSGSDGEFIIRALNVDGTNGDIICRVKFYRFHAYFYRFQEGDSGIGWRTSP